MLPEHVFTVVAVGHSIDAQNNTLTLFSVLEQIGSPTFPVRVPQFTLVTLWSRSPSDDGVSFTQRTRLVDPSAQEVASLDVSFTFQHPRQRIINTFANVPFNETGVYHLEVYIRPEDATDFGSAVTSYPLQVTAPDVGGAETLLPDDNG